MRQRSGFEQEMCQNNNEAAK